MVFRNFTYKINIIKDDTLAKAMLKNVTVAIHVVATHHGASDKVFFYSYCTVHTYLHFNSTFLETLDSGFLLDFLPQDFQKKTFRINIVTFIISWMSSP